ncbi:MAG: STAS domain-containing protein [Myxococcales bacterium]|nr:STAS domain-containing protein [Myxococcales bacterium]
MSTEGDSVIVRISGELDALTVVDLRPTMDRIVQEGHKKVYVDLSSLRLIDSCGVGAVVSLFRRVRAYGGKVEVKGVKDQPLAILKLLKLDRILMGA